MNLQSDSCTMSQINPASKLQQEIMDNITFKAQQLLCTLYISDYEFMAYLTTCSNHFHKLYLTGWFFH